MLIRKFILFIIPLLVLTCIGTSAFAQVDTRGGSFKIPAIKDTTNINSADKTPESDLKMPMSSEFPSLLEEAPILRNPLENQAFYMQKREQFADNGERYTKEMNKRQQAPQADNQPGNQDNQDLGTFRSGSKFVKIMCRDFSYVDGDKVSVLVNDEVVQSMIILGSAFSGFNLDLKPGFNKISFKALNQGTSGPNTAQFVIYDDTGSVISSDEWNLLTGVEANLVIIKE